MGFGWFGWVAIFGVSTFFYFYLRDRFGNWFTAILSANTPAVGLRNADELRAYFSVKFEIADYFNF